MRFIRWFRNISIARKLFFVVGTMALLIAIELFTLWFSLDTLSSLRAFVAGEGLWSKAEKDAIYHLEKYARTYNAGDYAKFQEFMKVPMGDHKTLEELSKKKPNKEIATQGFIEGRNYPDDVDGMVKLFYRFHNFYHIQKAMLMWKKADSTIALLTPIARRLNEEISKPLPSAERVDEIVSEIDPINQKLTFLEDEFSFTLGDGSRWMENMVLKILFIIVLTVELTGLILTVSVSIGITKGIDEIISVSNNISKANFINKAKIFSKDEIGELASSFNMMIDDLSKNINERALVEKSLRKQKDLYETLIETQSGMGQGIAITERKSIIYANDALCKMYGYSREEILNLSSFLQIIAPEDKEEFTNHLNQRLSGSESSDAGEVTIIRKDGRRINVEYSIKVIHTDGKLQSLSVVRDITNRKKAEEDLKQKTGELIRSNAELEQFAYVASHDLQEPLRMITSYVQLLEARYGDKLDQDAKEFIGYAVDGANRMRNLIHSLLEYSRVNRIKPFEKIETDDLLVQVLQGLGDKIKETQSIINVEKLPDIVGDPVLIGQLFQNLIENAMKFKTEKKSELTISGIKINEKEYLFSVKDNGIGVPKEYSEKIFIILQRLHTNDKYPGTGIGLAICKKIVERHSGKIWVESEPNTGSTFYFTIKEL